MLMFSSAYCCVLNIHISLLSLAGSAMTNILEKQRSEVSILQAQHHPMQTL